MKTATSRKEISPAVTVVVVVVVLVIVIGLGFLLTRKRPAQMSGENMEAFKAQKQEMAQKKMMAPESQMPPSLGR
jgi:ATP-dependent Zn protease